ncbi:MAG TPA: hypothetical protein VFF00_09190 [Candidatus Elarobacter sp.]|nr:hypothetical protein [Candidatus Elarobacter sp.]
MDEIEMVRLRPLLGSLKNKPSRVCASEREIVTVAASRSSSDHRSASTSPRRAPVYTANATAG